MPGDGRAVAAGESALAQAGGISSSDAWCFVCLRDFEFRLQHLACCILHPREVVFAQLLSGNARQKGRGNASGCKTKGKRQCTRKF